MQRFIVLLSSVPIALILTFGAACDAVDSHIGPGQGDQGDQGDQVDQVDQDVASAETRR